MDKKVVIILLVFALIFFIIYSEQQKRKEHIRQQIEHEEQERREREEQERREREEQERNQLRVNLLAKTVGQSIMDNAGGGVNLNTKVKNWNFDKNNNNFTVEVDIYWDGKYFSENQYNVEGVILYKLGDSEYTFSKTYANDNYLSLQLIYNGAYLVGAIAEAMDDE